MKTVRTWNRVYFSSDDRADRQLVEQSLSSRTFQVLSFDSVQECLAARQQGEPGPECLCVDLSGSRGAVASHEGLEDACRQIPTVVLADQGCIPVAVRAIKAGAIDVIERPIELSVLEQRLSSACRSLPTRFVRFDQGGPAVSQLTRCERRVLDCVMSAMTTKQISSSLHIGPQTAAKHKQRVLQKLGARNDVELVLTILGTPARDMHPAVPHSVQPERIAR